MATKTKEAAEATESREETTDGPLMDSVLAAVKKLLQKAKERGYVSYDEINQVLPPDQVSSEQIEDVMAGFSEMGITVVENEEQEDSSSEEEESNVRATGNLDDEDIGRTDDPVRMYLREMGSVELLSREGEIAIAKRIEAGREKMISGICESPLTILALLSWRQALVEGHILLRDIIDLDATYGGGPNDEDIAKEEQLAEEGDEAEGEVEGEASAKVNGEAAPKGEDEKDGKDGKDGKEGESSEEDDEEEASISLAAMEEALLPQVLDIFDQIAAIYGKLSKVQEKRLTLLQKGEQVPTQVENKYLKPVMPTHQVDDIVRRALPVL